MYYLFHKITSVTLWAQLTYHVRALFCNGWTYSKGKLFMLDLNSRSNKEHFKHEEVVCVVFFFLRERFFGVWLVWECSDQIVEPLTPFCEKGGIWWILDTLTDLQCQSSEKAWYLSWSGYGDEFFSPFAHLKLILSPGYFPERRNSCEIRLHRRCVVLSMHQTKENLIKHLSDKENTIDERLVLKLKKLSDMLSLCYAQESNKDIRN